MKSRLDLLDNASLFSLLVRTHYDDLQNILEGKPELRDITETAHFLDEWSRYNITTVVKETPERYVVKISEQVDRLGRKHGKHTEWCSNYDGSMYKSRECNYKCGQCHGVYISWYSPHQTRTPHQIQNCTSTYYNGRLDGVLTTYDSTGVRLERTTYSNGLRHGPYAAYHPNGNLKIEGTYQNDRNHGTVKTYYENGNLTI